MAVALWWKSKPFWKNVQMQEGKRKSRKFSEEEGMLLWNLLAQSHLHIASFFLALELNIYTECFFVIDIL